jgi:hypothetical protein
MTTDERIDAIAMHLEITARMVEDNEKRTNSHIDRILGMLETLTVATLDHQRRIERLEGQH